MSTANLCKVLSSAVLSYYDNAKTKPQVFLLCWKKYQFSNKISQVLFVCNFIITRERFLPNRSIFFHFSLADCDEIIKQSIRKCSAVILVQVSHHRPPQNQNISFHSLCGAGPQISVHKTAVSKMCLFQFCFPVKDKNQILECPLRLKFEVRSSI